LTAIQDFANDHRQLELQIGIIAACIPTLKAPFEQIMQKYSGSSSASIGSNQDFFPKMDSNVMHLSIMSNGWHMVDATVSTSRNGRIPQRTDVILVNESVSWESSSIHENDRDGYCEA
jgi:hypothetical protein